MLGLSSLCSLFLCVFLSCTSQSAVVDQAVKLSNCSTTTGMNWTSYHSYTTIYRYMKCLAYTYTELVTLVKIGNSYEGRPLLVARVGLGESNTTTVWLDGGVHAREWISPAAASYVLAELVINSMDYTSLLTNFTVYVMPVMNPDGYEYSRTTDRFWRKTRSRHNDSLCVGVDANRNWGYRWGGEGGSADPCCYQRYQGQTPFSEPETQAAKDFILSLDNVILYLSLHSYGQFILYPWQQEDEEEQILATVAVMAMGEEGEYVAMSAENAAGCSMGWAKGEAGARFAFTVELPPRREGFADNPQEGFELPASEIEGVGEKVAAAVVTMVGRIAGFGYV
eukprot:GFUD01014138.1.p1 GENE.GFUD01014138.1~~GFUD01014138.1.p1  ORF type:complete len:338 (+),score=102.31 GFUD01014138.1:97-1110(+)